MARFFSTKHNSLLPKATVPVKLLHFGKIIDHVKWLFFVHRRGKGGAKAGQKAGFHVMLKYFEIKRLFVIIYNK